MSIRITYHAKISALGRAITAMLMMTVFLLSGTASAQVNAEDNVIHLFGQIVNNVNGAPISSHKIHIQSDSTSNSGFNYYSTLYTDVNGFYYDSIVTSNNDGYIDIYLYDFDGNLVEASEYYRFNWTDEYQMEANFEIFDPNANQTTQANFESEEQSENEMKIHFRDKSSGYVIKSWFWEFGDGSFSEIQDPVHEYTEPGIYEVTLSISSKPQGNEYYVVSKITKRVMVGLADYYTMGGHIYAGSFPIDLGSAYLYKMDDLGNPVAVDTTAIDTLGYYYFYAVIEGDYLIKARLRENSEKYGEFIPTYLGNSFNWENATVVTNNHDNFSHHINLIESDGTKSGTGNISGLISYDTNTITTQYSPAEDIEIILMDGESICLTCKLSDLEGQFKFEDIGYGTYQLFPEVTGLHNEPMYITISEDTPGDDEMFNLVIQTELIMFSITEPQSPLFEGNIVFSPNPFRGKGNLSMNIGVPGSYQIETYDLKGAVVARISLDLDRGQHTVPINLERVPSGLYHIVIRGKDGVATPVRVIKQ